MRDTVQTIVSIEEREVQFRECRLEENGAFSLAQSVTKWDPTRHLGDPTGQRLFDEIATQLGKHWTDESVFAFRGTNDFPHRAVISMPGTLTPDGQIKSSSRLKIYEEFDAIESLRQRHILSTLVHDVEAMAWGELKQQISIEQRNPQDTTFAFILIDEGVGAKFIVNGTTFVGSGVAGTISRFVVQPEGAYFTKLLSRGNLEVFSSRPWISRRIVENFHSESSKTIDSASTSSSAKDFQRKLKALVEANRDWEHLSYKEIGHGVAIENPSTLKAVALAEKYMSRAIHAIMVILNPHDIVLSGSAVEQIPGFFENIVEQARDMSWPNCWNGTKITKSKIGRDAQFLGAAILAAQEK